MKKNDEDIHHKVEQLLKDIQDFKARLNSIEHKISLFEELPTISDEMNGDIIDDDDFDDYDDEDEDDEFEDLEDDVFEDDDN